MAAESLDIRMARLEGAYEQIDRRLGFLEVGIRDLRGEIATEFGSVRAEFGSVRGEFGSVRGEIMGQIGSVRGEMTGGFGSVRQEIDGVREEISDLRRDMRQQFYWVIGLIVVTILVPIALRFLPP